jgi:hypothetical protein
MRLASSPAQKEYLLNSIEVCSKQWLTFDQFPHPKG